MPLLKGDPPQGHLLPQAYSCSRGSWSLRDTETRPSLFWGFLLFTCQCLSQPQEANCGHPLSYSRALSPPLSCPPEGRRGRPRASAPGLGGSVGALAGEAQLGGWTPGPHPLNHKGTERDLG